MFSALKSRIRSQDIVIEHSADCMIIAESSTQ